jgi:hypothetical protein
LFIQKLILQGKHFSLAGLAENIIMEQGKTLKDAWGDMFHALG